MAPTPRSGGDEPRQAAAVGYDPERGQAPRILVQAAGPAVEELLDRARDHGVPVHEDPELARALGRLPLDAEIPWELYEAVAQVLAAVYAAAAELEERDPAEAK